MIHIASDKHTKTELEQYITAHLYNFYKDTPQLSMEIVGCDIMTAYDQTQDQFKLFVTIRSTLTDDSKYTNNYFAKSYVLDVNGNISPSDELGMAIYCAIKKYK